MSPPPIVLVSLLLLLNFLVFPVVYGFGEDDRDTDEIVAEILDTHKHVTLCGPPEDPGAQEIAAD
jgi:hypothetical protein